MENTIADIAYANKYKESGTVFWKEIENYLISMYKINDRIIMDIGTGLVNELMPMAIGEAISEISERDDISDCIIIRASIQVSFIENSLSSVAVEELVLQIISLLKEHRVLGFEKCQICNREIEYDEKVIIKVNNKLLKSHKSCYHKIAEDIEVAKTESKGSYISGTLGALLFGVIGTIPWILAGIFGWFVSILGMVIGISANYGYKLLNGKQSRVKAGILAVVTIVMVIGASFITELYDIFKYVRSEGIEGVTIMDGYRFLITILKEDSEYRNSFLLNTLMGVAFGLFGAWRVISEDKRQPKKANVIVELVQ